ncbi:iron chelate uptake ABC transporter family permease subunit [Saxibacter everestensis]|uniref:Iron chelate uptake ABC transporter family permease subunit n=1 Tax=Saxibacter everestensis TaxID=2909229 RepID=A0ABY8QQA6_9MICO|nr:iron chelate uptake ABC transporter family permease subunit [Brevibacteriaceae bacterium ZFBP1038]
MSVDHGPPPGRTSGVRHNADGGLLLSGRWWLVLLAAASVTLIALFMTLGSAGNWDFILPRRSVRVGALVLVAFAVATSTVLFQTITNNRILTPSIMGFDPLYILIQTTLAFSIGTHRWTTTDPALRYVVEIAIMVVFSSLLYRWLFTGASRSLHLMLLVGIIFGSFFRSLSSLMQRLIDPNEFQTLQDLFFASFGDVEPSLLFVSLVIVAGVTGYAWIIRHSFDVLALGRDTAINLGLEHQRLVSRILVMVAILVSVSTALVGPITFFGLLVANLAYLLAGSSRHRRTLPIAFLLAVIFLVGGQLILERAFQFDTSLSIIIEFIGGIVFIMLLLRRSPR